MHPRTFVPWLFVLLAIASTAAGQDSEEKIELVVGEQTTISARGVANYSEGAKGIVDVRVLPDGSRFVLVGERPGTTSLLLIMNDGSQRRYRIRVVPQDGGEDTPDPQAVSEQLNVRLDLYFVELTSRSDLQAGVAWPAFFGGAQNEFTGVVDMAAGGTLTSAILTFRQALPRIDMLHATGWGKLQRHVVLVTANGSQAEFDSGGRVNVAIPGSLGTNTLRSIDFGSRLRVVPRVDPNTNRIEVQIDAEISDLIETGQDLPGNSRTTASATANLELGQSIGIAGLQARTERANKTGLPGLSQIPIIGVLFGSHGTSSEETENVLFIVPSVIEPVDAGSRDLVEEALEIYSEASGDVEESGLLESVMPAGSNRHGTDAAD